MSSTLIRLISEPWLVLMLLLVELRDSCCYSYSDSYLLKLLCEEQNKSLQTASEAQLSLTRKCDFLQYPDPKGTLLPSTGHSYIHILKYL